MAMAIPNPSTSFPFLAIANHYKVPYWAVLALGDYIAKVPHWNVERLIQASQAIPLEIFREVVDDIGDAILRFKAIQSGIIKL
jgi:hypothetical protein